MNIIKHYPGYSFNFYKCTECELTGFTSLTEAYFHECKRK